MEYSDDLMGKYEPETWRTEDLFFALSYFLPTTLLINQGHITIEMPC